MCIYSHKHEYINKCFKRFFLIVNIHNRVMSHCSQQGKNLYKIFVHLNVWLSMAGWFVSLLPERRI